MTKDKLWEIYAQERNQRAGETAVHYKVLEENDRLKRELREKDDMIDHYKTLYFLQREYMKRLFPQDVRKPHEMML